MSLSAAPLTSAERIAQFEREQDMCDLWGALLSRSIYAAFQQSASAFGPATAITFVRSSSGPDRSISYKQLLEGITRTANFLGDVGGRGCGVAYMLPASIETHFLLWGAESVGYAVPLNPFLLPAEIVALVKAARCKLFVIPKTDDPEIAKRTEAVRQSVPGIRVIAIGQGPLPPLAIDYEHEVVRYRSSEATHFDAARPSLDTVAYFHTGGTTGTPKLVAHTSSNQLAAAAGAAAMLHLNPRQCLTNGMPMFHVGGTVASSLAPFLAGARIVVMSGQGFRNPDMISGIWRIVERCKVTALAAVPTAMGALLSTAVDTDISSIQWGLTGAASCPQSVIERFQQVTGASLHEVLGMTETGGVTAVDPVGDASTAGSVGFRLPHTRLRVRKLLDDGALGADCDVDMIGVLFVEGAHVSSGYLDPTHNEGVFVEGGLNTGDLAYFGENGKLFVAGRSKDLIIRSGHNIDPGTIESACASHPAVSLAAAVGQPDAYAGELPVVFVSLKPGYKADIPELTAHTRERIAERPAWPKSIYIVDSIPVTAVGKIYKPALRVEAARRSLTDQITQVAPGANFQMEVASAGKRGLHVAVELSATDEASRSAVETFLKAHTFSWSLRNPSEIVYGS
ncbi:AMP-binding protein [Variovorax guangxiensis]|uniref:Fatty-acyl-CoA synthase n=1 Tax=Variovorax guangxiensis TaxID=1775474 RepID=A0A840G3M3_9BURK|nr:AMP-binding protein [Variovorax guangxiensis]MBB4225877.1 fatty-acyl-CoA synthase [Variovorax guangxiensis]